MMPHEPIQELLKRTVANLEFIEKHAKGDGPYEVTQLINSFLAGLAHPWEEYKQELKSRSIEDAIKDGWPRVPKERPTDIDPKHLSDLLRLVRNSFAHGNIEFRSTDGNQITHLRFWNEDPKQNYKRTWGTVIAVPDLHQFLMKFAELADALCEQDVRRQSS